MKTIVHISKHTVCAYASAPRAPPSNSKKFLAYINKVNYDILNKNAYAKNVNYKEEYESFDDKDITYTYLLPCALEYGWTDPLSNHCEEHAYDKECRVFDL